MESWVERKSLVEKDAQVAEFGEIVEVKTNIWKRCLRHSQWWFGSPCRLLVLVRWVLPELLSRTWTKSGCKAQLHFGPTAAFPLFKGPTWKNSNHGNSSHYFQPLFIKWHELWPCRKYIFLFCFWICNNLHNLHRERVNEINTSLATFHIYYNHMITFFRLFYAAELWFISYQYSLINI